MENAVELSVVIPVYNSSEVLPELLRQLTETLEAIGREYDIILVEDASPDNSWTVIQEHLPRNPRVSAIRLMRNCGQAAATICGDGRNNSSD